MLFSARNHLLLATAFVASAGFINPISAIPKFNHSPLRVHEGQSIQAAIDAAKPYSKIYIEQGTFAEQLTINKDGITLIGRNTKLIPPKKPKKNTCSGLAGTNPFTTLPTQAGICITGSDVKLETFVSEHKKFGSVGRRVKDVKVTGFEVRGFDGLDIAIVGAEDTTLCDNTLVDGYTYGALTLGSKKSVIERNIIIATPPVAPNTFISFIAICMDDINSVSVAYNTIKGYNIGLCVETNGANVHDNHVENVCIGAYVDPGVNHAHLIDNTISASNPLCRGATNTTGAFGVWGIAVAGAQNTLVKGNQIVGITDGFATDKFPAAGIAVFDDFPAPDGTGTKASGNKVINNVIVRNDLDLSVSATGRGNVENHNVCKTSYPDGLCK